MERTTRFDTASITKLFTAVARNRRADVVAPSRNVNS